MESYNNIILRDENEVYCKVECEPSIAYELRDHFTFIAPGAQFSPKFKAKLWNGKIYLFNAKAKKLYRGHIQNVREFATERGYSFQYVPSETHQKYTESDVLSIIQGIGPKYTLRDYQTHTVFSALNKRRGVFISPTASGKSLVSYILMRQYLSQGRKGLIIVPKVQLVEQLYTDFIDYSEKNNWKTQDNVHLIYSGKEKVHDTHSVFISTWQSLFEMPRKYFEQFDYVINDEVHLSQAKSLTYILSSLTEASDRIGLTGTLSESKTHELVITGLFGPVQKIVSTRELMDAKHISDFKIKCLLLKYPEETCKKAKSFSYQEEIEYLILNEERNKFIAKLALQLQGNTLLLYQYVEKHGKILYELLRNSKRKVFLIHGKIDVEIREKIREIVETVKDAIIIASFGTTSTGTNIKNLHNIIFASPSKSRVRNLQSIGRTLRKTEGKDIAILYDIADDLKYKNNKSNYTLLHFEHRLKTYAEEKFPFKIFKIDLAKG